MERDYDPYERRSRAWLWALLLVLAAFVGGGFAMGYAVTHDARTARMLHLQTIEQAQAQAALAQHIVVRPSPATTPAPTTPPVAAADPQINHRQMIVELAAEDGRRARVVGNPMKFAESQRQDNTYPPAAGEHTEAVLKEILNLSQGEIDGLVEAGAVAARRRPQAKCNVA